MPPPRAAIAGRIHPRPRRLPVGAVLALVLVVVLVSALGTNAYQYGVGDTSITIPFVKQSIDPQLYPGDYLIAQRPFYYTYLWDLIALIERQVHVGLPALYFGIYLAALYATFLALYLISAALFENPLAGVLTLVFLLFYKPTLGGVEPVAGFLNTREVATPLLLLALHALLVERPIRAFLWLGIAYLVHPLTTHVVLAMVLVVALARRKRHGWKTLSIGGLTFLAIASPILVWRYLHSPPSFSMLFADPAWLGALRERSPHHMFPSTWGWNALGHAAALFILFLSAWPDRPPATQDRHRAIALCVWTIIGLSIIGIVGSELIPVGGVLLVQPLRAFQFMEYFAALYLAHHLVRVLERAEEPLRLLPAAAIGAGIFVGVSHWARPLALFVLVMGMLAFWRLGARRSLRSPGVAWAVATLVAVAGVATFAFDASHRDGRQFSIQDAQAAPWLDVQHWARRATDRRDAFIVPPAEEDEFRVESERTVYADWEDGGLLNANPTFGEEWLRRMRRLGFHRRSTLANDYCALREEDVRGIANEMRAGGRRVFIVEPRRCGPQDLPLRYRNAAYEVREVDR